MFFAALCMLAIGYPVAFTFGSVSIFFGAGAALIEMMPGASLGGIFEEFFLMFSMMPFRLLHTAKPKIW